MTGPPHRARRRNVLTALGLTLAVGVAAGLLMSMTHGQTELSSIWHTLVAACIYTGLIGLPAAAFMDTLFTRLSTRGRLFRAALAIAVLLAMTAAGCAAAGLVFIAIGWSSPEDYWVNFVYSSRVALVIGAIITVSASAWEGLRHRLDASQLAEARAKELAAEARLQALEARVHPHFLFNTLNSVLSLIPADPVRAEELLENLARLLRFSLDAGRAGLIPLSDELRIVRDYLDIESARLGERLRTAIEIEPGLEARMVPPFSLQTLVENSVRHAIAPRRRGGELRIRARRAGDRLELSVWDDGDGFSRAALRPGHGLENLEGRLAALFGGRGRLDIGRDGGGTAVTVEVPS
jgi:hypothetical protein